MKFLYRTKDVKLINYVKTLPYLKDKNNEVLGHEMAEMFFRLKYPDEVLGLVEADTKSVVSQEKESTNFRSTDEFEFLRIAEWEEKFSRQYTEDEWREVLTEYPFAECVAKVFWLSNHLRVGGSIEFPITQAWNPCYNTWEVIVGNGRLAPLRLFYHKPTIPVIRFKTSGCNQDIQWTTIFNSLQEIINYFGQNALINFRAWGGSLIPGVHFYDKEKYDEIKLGFQNKLALYYKKNDGLGINPRKSLHHNINKILDGLNALG